MGRDRRKRRYRADCPAQIVVPDLAPASGVAIDLSLGGAFLETEAALPLGLNVRVRLSPAGHGPFTLSGRILRVGHAEKPLRHSELDFLVVRAVGLAVKFEPLDKPSERRFEAFLQTLDEQ